MKSKPRLSQDEKNAIALLAAQGKTPNAIAGVVERDPKTIRASLKTPDVVQKVSEYQERIATKYEELAERILDAISEEDLLKSSLQQKVTSSGICTDKARLIKGQSTVNLAAMFARAMEEDTEEDTDEDDENTLKP